MAERYRYGGAGQDSPVRVGDGARADRCGAVELRLRLGRAADPDRPLKTALARQIGQSLERIRGTAERLEELVEHDRPDILAGDQPQPIEPLLVRKDHAFEPSSIFASSPLR